MTWVTNNISRAISISLSLFLLYTAYVGTFYPYVQRAIPLMLTVMLTFITLRATPKTDKSRVPFYDWLLALAAVPIFGYAALYSDYLANRWPLSRLSVPTHLEIVFGVAAALLLLEAVRRTIGPTLVVVALVMLAYIFFGDKIPWQTMQHGGYTVSDAVDYLYLTIEGIWGSALAIAATYIALFVIFGAFMEKGGATDFFVDISNAIAGESQGGPAKVAIFGSGLVGSVTGSTVANVYTTGQLTIPLMKKVGYRPSFAGAVEALASNGGQLMPPVMGATAFILASNAGMPYFKVAVAAIIPALLYFGALFWYIHLEAIKRSLPGLPKGSAPKVGAVLLRGGYLLLPLGLLIGLLARGYSPMLSGFYAIVSMVLLSWVRKETRIGPREFVEALDLGARNSVMIMVVCAAVGIVVGTFTLTGLGLSLSSAIISLAGGNFIALLLLIAVAGLLMGTGMNTIAAYILVSIVAVPALTAHGVNQFTANMYVFYISLLSMITPPVCLAVFAGAAIAGANIWETAFVAMRIGAVAYILPFLAIFTPGILLVGSSMDIIIDSLSAALGLLLLVSAIQNWMLGRMNRLSRALALAGSIGLFWPSLTVNALGLTSAVASVAIVYVTYRRKRRVTGQEYQGDNSIRTSSPSPASTATGLVNTRGYSRAVRDGYRIAGSWLRRQAQRRKKTG